MCPTSSPPEPGLLVVLVRLRPDADRAAYERFSAEIDRPGVLAHYRSVAEWRLHRVDDTQAGRIDYIEIATVNDVAQLRHDMQTPAAAELVRQAREHVDELTMLFTRPAFDVEPA